ncbi:MAG: SSS family solute:Na+ symporter, partial [Vicingaceae bacterium]
WDIPYYFTVAITILLIWVYTAKGGIKTIVWTDALQTLFMLLAVGVGIYQIGDQLNLGFFDLIATVRDSEYSQIFFFDDWKAGNYFWKQFLSGAFITIVMTGLDQDMMQKNLSCKNLKEAKWNMFSMSVVLVFVNLLFLGLGALLYLYSNQNGIAFPAKGDDLFPGLALDNTLGMSVAVFFILGLIAAAYSSADSALTALTTSVCIDFLNVQEKPDYEAQKLRKRTHIIMSVVLYIVILIFSLISDDSVISTLFKVAGYTYGPLLGLYAFGLIHKFSIKDRWVPLVCLICPVICYIIQLNSIEWLNGYVFGFELLMLNGFLTYTGLHLLRSSISTTNN